MESSKTTLTSWLLTNVTENPDGAESVANLLGGDGAPKLKFLFSVEFGLRDLVNIHRGSKELQTIRYDLKSATRPNITVNQESVNYYGYRTKVATRISYGTIKLTFYEDALNTSHNLLWEYMKKISPLTTYIGDMAANTATEEVSGVVILGGGTPTTVGPLVNPDGLIAWMKVHHHYMNFSTGRKMITTYTCMNPKIESIEHDELDMSNSEASTIGVVFTIDGVRVEHTVNET